MSEVGSPEPAASEPAGKGAESRWRLAGVGAVLLLAAAHAALVGLRYHVGSFDDDGHYILLARAFADARGYVDLSVPGAPIEATVPPGYPALLAPLAALFPGATLPFRVLSGVCWLALFPLVWHWLRLARTRPGIRLAVLALLALNPVGATFASMVMAELPLLVALLLLLIALHHWDGQAKTSTGWSWLALAMLVSAVYMKTAAAGFVPGVVLYLVVRRRWAKAAFALGGSVLLLAPLYLARAVLGIAVAGERYAGDFARPYHGPFGAVRRSFDAIGHYATTALPDTVLPIHVSTLQGHGPVVAVLLQVVYYSVTPLTVAGFAAWAWRRRDVTVALVPVYLVETLPYPFINERRLILVLPVLLAWYVGGLALLGRAIRAGAAWAWRRPVPPRPVLAALAGVLIVPPLAVQLPRDYLFGPGVDSSQPAGSAYYAVMRAASDPGAVFASTFRWTTAAFTGHPTTRDLGLHSDCARVGPERYEAQIRSLVAREDVAVALTAALLKPHRIDEGCLFRLLDASAGWAVRLYQQRLDLASVYELIGPGTPHPRVSDVVLGRTVTSPDAKAAVVPERPLTPGGPVRHHPTVTGTGPATTLTVSFGHPVAVRQVSLGRAVRVDGAAAVATPGVAVSLRRPDGSWARVAAAARGVGPEVPGGPAFLLRRLPLGLTATAVRVSFAGRGRFAVHDLHVLADRDRP